MLELEAGLAVLAQRPFDAFRAQCVGHSHHVQQIPAAALVLPFARVGIDQVAPEQVARDFIVETDGVVADAYRARLVKCLFDGLGELMLRHAQLQAVLRCDAGDQARLRVGQEMVGRLAIQHDGRADVIEVGVGADRGELGRAIAARLGAKGFVVVPKESLGGHKVAVRVRCNERDCKPPAGGRRRIYQARARYRQPREGCVEKCLCRRSVRRAGQLIVAASEPCRSSRQPASACWTTQLRPWSLAMYKAASAAAIRPRSSCCASRLATPNEAVICGSGKRMSLNMMACCIRSHRRWATTTAILSLVSGSSTIISSPP